MGVGVESNLSTSPRCFITSHSHRASRAKSRAMEYPWGQEPGQPALFQAQLPHSWAWTHKAHSNPGLEALLLLHFT